MKPKPKPFKYPFEHIEQRLFVQWAKRAEIPIFAIPNGGLRNRSVASKLKLEGVSAGVPDLFIPVAVGIYHGLFVEMKRQKGGKLSEEQKVWKLILEYLSYKVIIGKGFESAKEQTMEYLNLLEGENYAI
jgi:hypothetical protein